MAVNSQAVYEQSILTFSQSGKESLLLVFQCKGCNNIIGDSSAFISSDQELEIICLNAITSFVSAQECLETSTEGPDVGSTFRSLQCTSCKSVIGRVYRTTPKEYDPLRGMFCLDVEHIRSYQVGSMNEKESVSMTSEDILDIPTLKNLQDRINKVECVIIMLMEKMGLEGTTNEENDNTAIHTSQTSGDNTYSQVTAKEKEEDLDKVNKPKKKKRK